MIFEGTKEIEDRVGEKARNAHKNPIVFNSERKNERIKIKLLIAN